MSGPARDRWPAARRILAVRLDALGDVLMTTPAIRALKEAVPGRTVTLLTSSAGAAVARLVEEIDDVIAYDAPWMKATRERQTPDGDLATIARIRERRFDAAVIFTVYSQNPLPAAMLCYLADVPLRLAHAREPAYQLLTDRVPEPEPDRLVRHEVRRQLDLVATVGCSTADERMRVRVGPLALRRIERLLERHGLDTTRPWAVVHSGASAPSRRYPPVSFAAAASILANERGWRIVVSGSDADRSEVEELVGAMSAPATVLTGELDVEGLAALLSVAPVLIANNSGPVHLAAAVGTPVVDLYALTNPQHTPWGVASRVLFRDVPCRNCYASACPHSHHACLRGVAPRAVADAAVDLVGGGAATVPSLDGAIGGAR